MKLHRTGNIPQVSRQTEPQNDAHAQHDMHQTQIEASHKGESRSFHDKSSEEIFIESSISGANAVCRPFQAALSNTAEAARRHANSCEEECDCNCRDVACMHIDACCVLGSCYIGREPNGLGEKLCRDGFYCATYVPAKLAKKVAIPSIEMAMKTAGCILGCILPGCAPRDLVCCPCGVIDGVCRNKVKGENGKWHNRA